MGRTRKHHDDYDYEDDIDVRSASGRSHRYIDDEWANIDEPSEGDYNDWDELDDGSSLNFGN